MTIQGDVSITVHQLRKEKEPHDCPYCGATRLYQDTIYNRYTLQDDNVWGCIICCALWVTTDTNTHDVAYVIDYPVI